MPTTRFGADHSDSRESVQSYGHIPNTDLAAAQAEDSLSSPSRFAQAGNINILIGRESL